MKLGMVGLGRMGANMAARLLRAGHEVVAFDRKRRRRSRSSWRPRARSAPARSRSWCRSSSRRARSGSWCRRPSSTSTIAALAPLLAPRRRHHRRRQLATTATTSAAPSRWPQSGIRYVDVGTSGGVWGKERGYCQMIGGDADVVERLDPIFAALAPPVDAAPRTPGRSGPPTPAEHGYLRCGPSGAGHFVKMVHNGIEYGLMAAYAEGLNILRHANAGKEAARRRRRDGAAGEPRALPVRPRPARHRRGVAPRQRHRLVAARPHGGGARAQPRAQRVQRAASPTRARAAGRSRPPSTRACRRRSSRRRSASASPRAARQDFADRMLSAMRFEFGGHEEKHS